MTFILDEEKTRKLNDVVFRLIGRDVSARNALAIWPDTLPKPAIDISKPNMHDSKKEFRAELNAVTTIVDNLQSALGTVVKADGSKSPEHSEMIRRLTDAVKTIAAKRKLTLKVDHVSELVVKNVFEVDFFWNSWMILYEMSEVYASHLKDLRDQEKQFWNVSNRSPNHFARTIALRLARLYAREKRQKPTLGVSSEGNFPSTDFGRAVEEVFNILEINAAFRNSAKWAIKQLTDDDINPPQNALGSLFGMSRNALSENDRVLPERTLKGILGG